MKSVCFFASYFSGTEIPYYITVYLTELKRHFSEVVFLTTEKNLSKNAIDFLEKNSIQFFIEINEGFDFGLWYKAFQKIDSEQYDQVALINDSCVLFKPLTEFMNWSKTDKSDLQGMTYSEAIAPHIQSFLLIINKNAIKPVKDYFAANGIIKDIKEVIKTYEVGMSTYLVSKGFTISAYMAKEDAKSEFSPYYSHVKDHLRQGIPLIKKKILFSSYRKDELFTLARMNFDLNEKVYIDIIKQKNKNLILSFDELYQSGQKTTLDFYDRLKYNVTRLSVQLYRKIRYGN